MSQSSYLSNSHLFFDKEIEIFSTQVLTVLKSVVYYT